MTGFFVPSENSVVLKDGEGVNIGIYLFPFLDMLMLGVITLIIMLIGKRMGVNNPLVAVLTVIGLMFIHVVAFQAGISPMYRRFKKLRRSMLIRDGHKITLITCDPDDRIPKNIEFSIRSLARIEREIQVQHFASEYMKQNYFLNDRTGGESDIISTEYNDVALIKERKKYYIFSGIEAESGKRKPFKVYKAYTDIYKIKDDLPQHKDIARTSQEQILDDIKRREKAVQKFSEEEARRIKDKEREKKRAKEDKKKEEERKRKAIDAAQKTLKEEEERKRKAAEEEAQERKRREEEERKAAEKQAILELKQQQKELKQKMKEQQALEAQQMKELARIQKEQQALEAQKQAELELKKKMEQELLAAKERAEKRKQELEQQKELHKSLKQQLAEQQGKTKEELEAQFIERKQFLNQQLMDAQSRENELKGFQKLGNQLTFVQREEIKEGLEQIRAEIKGINAEIEDIDRRLS